MNAKFLYARNILTGLYYVWGKGFIGDIKAASELTDTEAAAVRACFLNVDTVPVDVTMPELENHFA